MTEPRGGARLAPNDPRLDAWRAFLVAHARLFRRLDDELRVEHSLSLPEYETLLQIAQAPDRRMRMSRIANRVLLSKSGVTRLVDRLVADGFVERSQCSSDARGAEAGLTPAGLERLRAASTTHLRGIERYFLSAIEPSELAALGRMMESISQGTGGESPLAEACEPPATTDAAPAARVGGAAMASARGVAGPR
ncbi:MAG: MarR family transcriptional regulator [Chloroflexota bacterium]|nr:MarR family transcriptional regulator [Chloroflexota bacterium]